MKYILLQPEMEHPMQVASTGSEVLSSKDSMLTHVHIHVSIILTKKWEGGMKFKAYATSSFMIRDTAHFN